MRPWSGEHFDGRNIRERGGTEYSFSASGVRIAIAGESFDIPIRWAFGSGVQAITPLIEQDGKCVEQRLSWYRDGNRLGLTPGHDPTPAADLAAATGIVQTERNARRCFGCHTTAGEPGVFCHNCHSDGAEHRKAPSRNNIVRNRSVDLCARCHRSPDREFVSFMPEVDDPQSIRFAPVGFTASRCFRESRGFTCVSCHDPHGEPRKRTVDAVCGDCDRAAVKGSCPRAPDCASCHMKQTSPMPGLRFTDHRIRVFAD